MKNKLAIFFNNHRGLEVYKKISKFYKTDVFLTKKNLNLKIKKILKKKKIKFKFLNEINNKTYSYLKKKNYYLLVAAGWPLIFNNKIISAGFKGTINLHAGKLPNYRGGSPVNWQMINGEKYIYINVIKMIKKLDAGPIYEQAKIKISNNDNINKIQKKINKIFPLLTLRALEKIKNNIDPKKQKNINIKYFKQRKDSDGLIHWRKMSSKQVFNFVRAISKPYPGAFYFNKNGKKNRVFSCKISKIKLQGKPGSFHIIKNKVYVKCNKGSVQIR